MGAVYRLPRRASDPDGRCARHSWPWPARVGTGAASRYDEYFSVPSRIMSNVIADVGQNPVFVAFMAHAGFGYAVVLTTWAAAGGLHPAFIAASAMTVAAALKEFWFDARFEMHPPQTFKDNLLDFVGYAAGVAIALAVALALAR